MELKDYTTEELKKEIFRRFNESNNEILMCAIYTRSTIEARLDCIGRSDLANNTEFINKIYELAKHQDFQRMLREYECEDFSAYDTLIDVINECIDEYEHPDED